MSRLIILLAIFATIGPNVGYGETIGRVLKRHGFRELRPPVNNRSPGEILVVDHKAGNGVVVSRVCSKTAAFDGAEVVQSRSASVLVQKTVNRKFSLEAAVLGQLKASVDLRHVKEILLILENVIVLEIPDDEAVIGAAERTEACEHARQMRVEQGERVTVIKALLNADGYYLVRWKTDVTISAEEKQKALEDIAASIGAGTSVQGERIFVGKELTWGIRDDIELAALTAGYYREFGFQPFRKEHLPESAIPADAHFVFEESPD